MNKYASAIFAVSTLVLGAAASQAATLTVTNVSGVWSDWTGGVKQSSTMNGDVAELRWGTPGYTKQQSGYDFAPVPTSGPHQKDQTFTLGTFTHNNFVIDKGISSATLDVTFSFYLGTDSSNVYTRSSQFVFEHWETPNVPESGICVDGKESKPNGVQVGCEDRVTPITNPRKSESFTITEDGVTRTYLFDVTGFNIGENFWTVENQKNSAQLQARFTYEENVPLPPVPLPAAGWLMLAGVAGMGAVARRRRKA